MYNYIVLGSGKQGTAIAYDLAKFGNASSVILADVNLKSAKESSDRVNSLLGQKLTRSIQLDIYDKSNPKIIKAIKDQADLGTSYGAPTEAETSIGELIRTALPSIEKIRMVNSGTEATMSCIRLARGYTGRNKIIKFTGCYHGHVDSLLIKAGSGVSTASADLLLLPLSAVTTSLTNAYDPVTRRR